MCSSLGGIGALAFAWFALDVYRRMTGGARGADGPRGTTQSKTSDA